MTIYLPLFVCLIGLILFLLVSEGTVRAKVGALALHMFWVGLLAWLLVGGQAVRLIGK